MAGADAPRVGIFGGTFDPPHVGHLIAASDACELLALDEVRFVPTHRSPFKEEQEGTTPTLRCKMVERAIAGDPRFRVSRVEVDRPPPSYTVETLRRLREAEPAAEFTLLLGADQWTAFARWREPHAIAQMARIAVLTRDGWDPAPGESGPALPRTVVPVTRIDISASGVRDRVREGRSIRHMVPDAVREFIESRELYHPC